jgi:hypothetical protein
MSMASIVYYLLEPSDELLTMANEGSLLGFSKYACNKHLWSGYDMIKPGWTRSESEDKFKIQFLRKYIGSFKDAASILGYRSELDDQAVVMLFNKLWRIERLEMEGALEDLELSFGAQKIEEIDRISRKHIGEQ